MDMQYIPVPEGLQTAAFVLGHGANELVPELLNKYFTGKIPWIIADGNTWNAAGKKVYELLENNGFKNAEPYIFPADPRPHPDYAISQKLAEIMPQNAVPVAVGSGVINDLVKCAAGINNVRYCCVATACSVDGYSSNGGAMSVGGQKKTVPCPAPYAICADIDVLKTAPAPMFAAGYADLLAKVPAGADWLIADILGIEAVDREIWSLIQEPLSERISDSSDMGKVFAGLASSGYGMQMYPDSRPASGAEHMFSHVWEMEGLTCNGEEISHGFKVGIGVLIAVSLMEYIIDNDFETLRPRMKKPLSKDERFAEVSELYKRNCYGNDPCRTAMQKYLTPEETAERRELIASKWHDLQNALKKQIVPFAELKKMLKNADCPTTPAEIGLGREQTLHAVHTAQTIRIRYTILDLLYECGLLDDACKTLDKLF